MSFRGKGGRNQGYPEVDTIAPLAKTSGRLWGGDICLENFKFEMPILIPECVCQPDSWVCESGWRGQMSVLEVSVLML